MRRPLRAGVLAIGLVTTGCAHSPAYDPQDPLETVNRGVFTFNRTADRYVLRPVARGYEAVTPQLVRKGIRNFFSNLFYPTVLVNDLLQLKFEAFAQDFCRLVINTGFGLGGLIDVATPGGLPERKEDFGQTLGHWGLGQGWYLMLPLVGPTTNRDLVGRVPDYWTNPLVYLDEDAVSWSLGALELLEARAGLLPLDQVLEQQLDPYVFVRTAYLEYRQNLVYDGNPPREEFDFDEEAGDEAGD